MGKAKSNPHYASPPSVKSEHSIPLIGVDYAFCSNTGADDEDWAEIKVMAVKDAVSKYTFAVPVPVKGLGKDEWAVRQLIKAIEFLGYKDILIKCDQESGLTAVVEKTRVYMGDRVTEWAPEKIGIENSPVKDSQSNGMIERGIQSIEGQIRTLKGALEERLSTKLTADECIMSWLVIHAAETIKHFQMIMDGKTPFQRLRGGR